MIIMMIEAIGGKYILERPPSRMKESTRTPITISLDVSLPESIKNYRTRLLKKI